MCEKIQDAGNYLINKNEKLFFNFGYNVTLGVMALGILVLGIM